jgi:prepilin signal peptidase PulO-like enzyme (type II secretory pathway)
MLNPDSISHLMLLVAVGAIGASIGSFLNVCIYRIPIGLTVTQPRRSFCPHCKHQVEARDNIPVLSWLWLKGRCRYCKTSISVWYFLIEVFCGFGTAVSSLKGGITGAGSFLLLFSLLSIALRTAKNGFRPGLLLLMALLCATSLVLLQRNMTLAATPVPTLVCTGAGLLIVSRWHISGGIDWKVKLVIILAALACGWGTALAIALVIRIASAFTTLSNRFPGFADAILLLGVCLGPLAN